MILFCACSLVWVGGVMFYRTAASAATPDVVETLPERHPLPDQDDFLPLPPLPDVPGRPHPPYFHLAVVAAVMPETGAAQAGLQPGDVLIAVDGEVLLSPAELIDLLQTYQPGDQVDLTLRRSSETLQATAVLGSFPDDEERPFLGIELQQPTPPMTPPMPRSDSSG
jgi:membrane-associated protease RseP (regulator of RpoE activity)